MPTLDTLFKRMGGNIRNQTVNTSADGASVFALLVRTRQTTTAGPGSIHLVSRWGTAGYYCWVQFHCRGSLRSCFHTPKCAAWLPEWRVRTGRDMSARPPVTAGFLLI